MTGPTSRAENPAVVTIAHGRHAHLEHQRRHLAVVAPGVRHVVVAMDDPVLAQRCGPDVVAMPAHPEGLPLAAARNAGVAEAIDGGADLIVLLDVDCVPGPRLLRRYVDAAARTDRALLAGPVTYLPEGTAVPAPAPPGGPDPFEHLTDPHPARPAPPDGQLVPGGDPALFWSLSVALTPTTWEELGGFCEEYVGYGGEDTDLGVVAHERGVDLVWVGGAHAYHQFHPVSRPPVEHAADIVRNAHVFRRRWGRWPMEGWLRDLDALGVLRWGGPASDELRLADPGEGGLR